MKEVNLLAKRIEEKEAARKKEEQKIARLEKQTELLKSIKNQSPWESSMDKAIP